jgi:hypothetical protein
MHLSFVFSPAERRARHYHSILFSFDPFANIRRAIFKLHAIRFTTHKKAHYLAIDHANVFQIENDVSVVHLKLKKPSQLGYRWFFDPANQDEHCESPSRLSLDPESHQSANSANIPVAAVRTALLQSEQRSLECNRLPNRKSLKTGA